MSFMYPGFLWALTVLAIPIIIHLFNFRKSKKVYFSNVQFLESIQKRSKSKLQLKHILALMARLLMLLFLVLAFAMPYLPGESNQNSTQHIFLYLDNSQSMTVPSDGGATLFDEAYRMASDIVDLMPTETRFKLLTNDFAPFSNSFKSTRELNELLTEIQPSGNSRTLSEVIDRLQAQGDEVTSGQIFIISDFQKSTSQLSGILNIDTTKKINLIALEADLVPNVYIDSVYLDKPQLYANETNKISVRLANSGKKTIEEVLVKFFINDVQVAATSAKVSNNENVILDFDLNYTLASINKCKIVIEDYPLTFDNEYFFVLSMAKRARIVEIKGSSASNAFGAVYANAEMFEFKSFEVGNVAYSEAANADMLIVNELTTINQTLVSLFSNYVANGGNLLFVPAEIPDATSYNQVLPLPITQTTNKEQSDLAQLDYKNPFYDGVFNETTSRYAMPKATKRLTWPRFGDNLISFSNGDQFLSVLSTGKGRIILLSCPLKNAYTDFHRHAIFVPVMYKLVMTGMRTQSQLSYTLQDGTISIALDSVGSSGVYRLIGSEGETIPDQRVVGNNLIFSLPKSEISSGYYDIAIKDKLVTSIAINSTKEESIIENHKIEELKARFSSFDNVSISASATSEEFGYTLKGQYEGKVLWKYALFLVLIFLFIEVLILRFL